MRRIAVSVVSTAVAAISISGLVHAQPQVEKSHANSMLRPTVAMSSIPNWFRDDVKIAEHAKLSSGANYALYTGSDDKFRANMRPLFGVYGGMGHDIDFGMNLHGLYNGLKTNRALYGPLTDINVMERIWQAKKPIGEMVPAVSMDIGNANYLAFADGQIITASTKSGYIRYTVYSVKGVKVP